VPSFAALHRKDLPLLLPNAWDVPSALAFVAAGFEAVGTTSFGVASSLGRPDGARATREANTALARDLSTLDCHVSMDVEDGYADDPEEVAGYVATLPVAGVNIEDSTAGRLIPPAAYAAKVAAVKRRCPGLFVNARVDTYWLSQDATVECLHRDGIARIAHDGGHSAQRFVLEQYPLCALLLGHFHEGDHGAFNHIFQRSVRANAQ